MISKRNTWSSKAKRTITAIFFPVDKTRKGSCKNCGACCKLPVKCPFLIETKDGKFKCAIYIIRPMNCRKYPRCESEFLTQNTCGFKFD